MNKEYSIYRDPDIEFMDPDGGFPSEEKEHGRLLIICFALVATALLALIIYGELRLMI